MESRQTPSHTSSIQQSRRPWAQASPVTLLAPTGGATVAAGGSILVRWTGSDADGGPLTYAVLISPDDGATWRPVAAGLADTRYQIALGGMPGGDRYRVAVIASDGVNAGGARSARFAHASFALAVPRDQQVLRTGGRLRYVVQVRSAGGFTGPVQLDALVAGQPGLELRWLRGPRMVVPAGGVARAVLEVRAPPGAMAGEHTLLISGTSGKERLFVTASAVVLPGQ